MISFAMSRSLVQRISQNRWQCWSLSFPIPSAQSFYIDTLALNSNVHIINLIFHVSDWAVNIQRDSIASYIGHPTMLNYFATAMNESPARMRHNLLMRMISPCGPPPPSEEDSDSE